MAEVAPDSAEAVSTVNIEETDKSKETDAYTFKQGGLDKAALMKDEAPASPLSPPSSKKKASDLDKEKAKQSAAAKLGFADPESIKKMVADRLTKEAGYSVYDFYWTTKVEIQWDKDGLWKDKLSREAKDIGTKKCTDKNEKEITLHLQESGMFEIGADEEPESNQFPLKLQAPMSFGVFASTIAQHNVFENTTLAIISLNAVYIAIDTDWNKASSPEKVDWYFQAMEHFFCVYFTWEWVTRFSAFKRKCDCVKDAWFDFDSCLVFLMVMETWVVPAYLAIFTSGDGESPLAGGNTAILRLFRLLRLTRLMRMLRSLPQLMILIKGMIQAMRSVAYVMCLLIIITYVYSIAFTQLTVGTPLGETYFSGVWMGMYSLIIYATFLDDLSVFMDDIVAESTHLRIILLPLALTFIGLSALTLMNMLVGVLCEVVADVAEAEKHGILTEMVIEKMQKVAESLDEDGNGGISYEEFSQIVTNKEALNALEDVGVNPVGVVEFAELFFFDDTEPLELKFDKFMEMILDLREENTAKVKDTLEIWRHIKTSTNKDLAELKKDMKRVDDSVEASANRIQSQIGEVSSLVKQIASKR